MWPSKKKEKLEEIKTAFGVLEKYFCEYNILMSVWLYAKEKKKNNINRAKFECLWIWIWHDSGLSTFFLFEISKNFHENGTDVSSTEQ